MAPARKPPAKRPAAKKAPTKKTGSRGPGIGQGKRGQRLSAGAGAYESSNISGVQPTGVAYGAYDSGTTLEKIKRNEWLNSLSLEDRSFAMNQMGYFTGGVPTGTPKTSSKTLMAYGKSIGGTPGTYEYEAKPGVKSGSVTIAADGSITVNPYRADADGRAGKGGGKGVVKAGTTRPKKLTAKAKRPGSPGGKKVTAKERARIKKAKTKARGKGKGGGGGGGATEEEEEETFNPYAEADTSTTSYLRAQGKAYGRGQGESRAGQTESPGDSTVVEDAASGGGGRRRRPRRAKKLTAKAKRPGSPGGRKVTPRERKRIQRAKGK